MSENTINEIVRLWHGGSSRRRIARQLGISRHQVEKVLAAHQRGRSEGTAADQLPRAKRRRARSLDKYEQLLEQLLKRYPDITAVRAHEELQKLGFGGSYNAVKRGLRELRPAPGPERVQRFETAPGEQAQMDYSTYTIGFTQEGPRRVHLFSYVLGYSRRQYLRFVESQDFGTTIREHVRAFTHLGGVAATCLYDNMKVVVTRYDGDEPVYNTRFLAFATHYGYRPWACRPRRGQTKGKVERRIREAHFPGTHTLEQFDWAFNAAAIDRLQIEELATGDFIRRKDNLLVVGKSGVGKTHLLEGIGRRVCVLGYRVRYTLSEEMLAELGASLADGTTLQCVRDYLRPELLIIDGFGFDRIEREQTPQALNLLYKVIDQRNTKRSTALITNVEFDDWNQYLSDGPMVMALLDRLFDRAIILRIDGKSYRAHRARRLPPPGPKQPGPSSSGAKAKR